MRKPRIYIDGFNLSLEQGTGVATYSRNLSFALRDLGAEVGVLYGTSTSTISFYSLIREIAFFDPRVGKPSWLAERFINFSRAISSPFGEIATLSGLAFPTSTISGMFKAFTKNKNFTANGSADG